MALAAKDSRAQDSNAMTLTPRRREEKQAHDGMMGDIFAELREALRVWIYDDVINYRRKFRSQTSDNMDR